LGTAAILGRQRYIFLYVDLCIFYSYAGLSKNTEEISMKTKVYFFSLLWALSVLYLAPRIDGFNHDFIKSKGISERDIVFRTLGEAKNLVADLTYLKADEYYHGGVRHKNLEPHVCLLRDKEEQIGRKGLVKDLPHLHKHADENEGETEKTCIFNILPRIGGEISIHQHRHLHGEEEKEVVPWLYYSVKLNPHNIEAYVIGAYWVGSRLGKVDEALKFLREGMKYNPNAWQIYSEMGNLYFTEKQDYPQSIRFYSKAELLMNEENCDKFDMSHVLTFLGASYEKTGRADKAIEYYRKDLRLFPTHEGLIKRINNLEKTI